jgi:glycerol-3-phosphate dehydrogenase
MVINRLHKAAEGDIIVPQRQLSILGTSLWLTENPDAIGLPGDHIQNMFDLCSQMVPAVKKYPVHAVWSAARPLIAEKVAGSPQEISRSFAVYDHGPRDHLEGLISIIGGKATTLRVMAEKTADLICRKTGRNIPCNTKQYKLLHYRHFFQAA